jgi:hypothetical protein
MLVNLTQMLNQDLPTVAFRFSILIALFCLQVAELINQTHYFVQHHTRYIELKLVAELFNPTPLENISRGVEPWQTFFLIQRDH